MQWLPKKNACNHASLSHALPLALPLSVPARRQCSGKPMEPMEHGARIRCVSQNNYNKVAQSQHTQHTHRWAGHTHANVFFMTNI